MTSLACFLPLVLALGCGDNSADPDGGPNDAGINDTSDTNDDTDGTDGNGSCDVCTLDGFVPCEGPDTPGPAVPCEDDEECVDGIGCVSCLPGQTVCAGNDVIECDENGAPGGIVETCDAAAGELCSEGACVTACAIEDGTQSNIGCEFWAVDLPNSRGIDDASGTPWGVVLANAGSVTATVVIERNVAAFGQPQVLDTVENITVPVGVLQRIELPQREVTGWEPGDLADDAEGTALTSHAYRIRSTAPIVVYQFNNFVNDFSTDASLLLPAPALGNVHRVIGYPTANPIEIMIPGAPNLQGIPDFSSVTVVAKEDNTLVTVVPGTKTRPDGVSIPAAGPGQAVTEINVTLNAFDVLNVSSDGIPGDMTGTIVNSSKGVAVFTSLERGIGPAVTDPPVAPDYDPDGLCCTDHLEEQVPPAASLGMKYVVPHSPYRSPAGGYREPDELRFLGVAEVAHVQTNLAAPWDDFFLGPGQVIDAWTQLDAVVVTDKPIMISQVLVSQGFTPDFIGDPSLSIFPPIDQYRNRYVFLVPDTWLRNYIVLMARSDAGGLESYTLDGNPLPQDCEIRVAGTIDGIEWNSITCPMDEGQHFIESDVPFGLLGYGYGGAGSYAYVGGADVKVIYDVPPIG